MRNITCQFCQYSTAHAQDDVAQREIQEELYRVHIGTHYND